MMEIGWMTSCMFNTGSLEAVGDDEGSQMPRIS